MVEFVRVKQIKKIVVFLDVWQSVLVVVRGNQVIRLEGPEWRQVLVSVAFVLLLSKICSVSNCGQLMTATRVDSRARDRQVIGLN